METLHELLSRLYDVEAIIRWGGMAMICAIAPVVAGVGQMNYQRFVTYNVCGGVLWVVCMILTGYLIGAAVPEINKHIHTVIAVVIFLSILPAIIELVRARRSRNQS